MKMQTFNNPCKEIFIEGESISVTVNTWSNCEGASFMVHGNAAGMPLKLAGAFRWEELDVLLVALTAARSA